MVTGLPPVATPEPEFLITFRCHRKGGASAPPLEFLHFCDSNNNHPGARAPPLLNQEGSSSVLPSSDEEGRRPWRGVVLNRKRIDSKAVALAPLLEFLHFCVPNHNHPGAGAPPLLNQEGSS